MKSNNCKTLRRRIFKLFIFCSRCQQGRKVNHFRAKSSVFTSCLWTRCWGDSSSVSLSHSLFHLHDNSRGVLKQNLCPSTGMLSNREGLGGGGVGAVNISRTFEGRISGRGFHLNLKEKRSLRVIIFPLKRFPVFFGWKPTSLKSQTAILNFNQVF